MPDSLKAFWESLEECPAIRHQVVEVFHARTLQEISEWWCWSCADEARVYLRGPFLDRVRMVGGDRAASVVLIEFGRLAI